MYNSLQKQDFIDNRDKKSAYRYVENLFDKTEEYEKILNKDVCNFTRKEIEDMLIGFCSDSVLTLKTYLSLLSSYTNYCCAHQLSRDNINHYEEIDTAKFPSYVNQFAYSRHVILRERVLDWVEELYVPSDKFLVLALYEGIKGNDYEELFSLTLDDINKDTHQIKLCTGKVIVASKKLVEIAFLSGTTYEVAYAKRDIIYMDVPNIIKPRNNVSNNDDAHARLRITKQLARIKKELNTPEVSFTNLYKSGFMWQLRELCANKGYDPIEVLSGHITDSDIQVLMKRFDQEGRPFFQLKAMYAEYL